MIVSGNLIIFNYHTEVYPKCYADCTSGVKGSGPGRTKVAETNLLRDNMLPSPRIFNQPSSYYVKEKTLQTFFISNVFVKFPRVQYL